MKIRFLICASISFFLVPTFASNAVVLKNNLNLALEIIPEQNSEMLDDQHNHKFFIPPLSSETLHLKGSEKEVYLLAKAQPKAFSGSDDDKTCYGFFGVQETNQENIIVHGYLATNIAFSWKAAVAPEKIVTFCLPKDFKSGACS